MILLGYSFTYSQEGQWVVVSSENSGGTGMYSLGYNETYEAAFKKVWKGYSVQRVVYSFSSTNFILHNYRLFPSSASSEKRFNLETIENQAVRGYTVKEIDYDLINDSWSIIFEKSNNIIDQVFFETDDFPLEKLKENWGEYVLESIAYGQNKWQCVMSKMRVRSENIYSLSTGINPKKDINEIIKNGNYIIDVFFGNGIWVYYFTEKYDNTKQNVYMSKSQYCPISKLEKIFKKGHGVDAIAFGNYEMESTTSYEESIEYSSQQEFNPLSENEPNIYAVVVGVSKYIHINSLDYADDDAYEFYSFLKSPDGGALDKSKLKHFIDENAKKSRILMSLKEICNTADSNDMVIFYFSGHGSPGSFLPYDYNGNDNQIFHSEIKKIMESSRAKAKICIADACHSGNLKSKSNSPSAMSSFYSAFKNSEGGTILFMSSKAEELSGEFSGIRQGIFSYYLINGLSGAADINNNRIVTIGELSKYVIEKVKLYTKGAQTPIINGNYDKDLPLGVVRQ